MLLELQAMALLEGVQRRAVELDLGPVHALHGAENRLETLGGGVAAEHESPQPVVISVRAARELVDIDPVPDRPYLGRAQRKGAAVDADYAGGELLGGTQRRRRLPVRVPQ